MLSQNKAVVPENLISLAKKTSQMPVGIVSAHQAAAMESAKQAFELNLIIPIFIGGEGCFSHACSKRNNTKQSSAL